MAEERPWPEYSEILAKKCLDTAHRWFHAYTKGKITRREMFLITDALHDTLQGIGPEEARETIYKLRQDLKEKRL